MSTIVYEFTRNGVSVYREVVQVSTDTTKYSLTVSVNPSGKGSIVVSPAGPYDPNTSVTITANSISGYKFNGWSGDASGTANPVTVVMNGNKSVSANFIQIVDTDYIPITWNTQWSIGLQIGTVLKYVGVVDSGKTYMKWNLYGVTQELLADVLWTLPDGTTRAGKLMGDTVNSTVEMYNPVPAGRYTCKITCTQAGGIIIRTICSPA